MQDLDLGYVAGFFDGEGSINISLSRTGYGHLHMTVGQTRPDVLHQLAAQFGGSVNGPYRQSAKKDMWHWSVNKGATVASFLEAVYPWLIVKKTEAWLAMEFAAQYRKLHKGMPKNERESQRALRLGYKYALQLSRA